MNKKLLVLGASLYQLKVINDAKNLGHQVIVTDNVPSNPGHSIATKSYLADTTDRQAIYDIAKKEKIDGIISPCTDVSVSTAAFVANKLDLPSPPLTSTEILTSKLSFREFQKSHGIPCPDFIEVLLADSKIKTFMQPDHQYIIKPDQSSGSKGIFLIKSYSELLSRFDTANQFSLNEKVICEDALPGYHGTIEGILKNSQIISKFFFKRKTAESPYVCTIGHTTPDFLAQKIERKLLQSIEEVFNLLNISDTVFDADFIVSENQIYILEISPRLGGNSLSQLIEISSGLNIAEIAINIALSEPISVEQPSYSRCSSVILLGVQNPGTLTINEEIKHNIQSYEWVIEQNVHNKNGDPVLPFVNGRHCIATVFIQADDLTTLAEREKLIRSLNLFTVQPTAYEN